MTFGHLFSPLWFSISYNMCLNFVSRSRSMCWCPSSTLVFHLSPVISLLVPLLLIAFCGLGQRILGSYPFVSPIVSLLISSLLLDSGWAGTEYFGSYVFVARSTYLCTVTCLLLVDPRTRPTSTWGNRGICSALRRSCLAQTLFESQLAQKQAV